MKRVVLIICVFVFFIAFNSCNLKKTDKIELSTNKYSNGFSIEETNNGYKIIFRDNSNPMYLTRDSSEQCENCVKIPINRAICFSTTYTAFISVLEESNSIVGISGANYVYDSLIYSMIEAGKILEVGYDKHLDMEKIISMKPDVVFAYGVDNESISSFQKLKDLGVKVVVVNDYLESTPLGRTEWVKLFGCFYDKLSFAQNYFDSVENRYNKIKKIEVENHPKVLVGLPWKGTWWIPGGNSFFANFITDAGGIYLFDNQSTESLPYSIEQVFAEASSAEIWLHPNEKIAKKQIPDSDSRLENFSPLKYARIYNNNKRIGKSGGSDFWESGILHPDIVLQDLHAIFNNDSVDFQYYIELK